MRQRRDQKGPNRFAPALTGANSREANGADTEIRTQDLLFTNREDEQVILNVWRQHLDVSHLM